jgi:hypothetical protein
VQAKVTTKTCEAPLIGIAFAFERVQSSGTNPDITAAANKETRCLQPSPTASRSNASKNELPPVPSAGQQMTIVTMAPVTTSRAAASAMISRAATSPVAANAKDKSGSNKCKDKSGSGKDKSGSSKCKDKSGSGKDKSDKSDKSAKCKDKKGNNGFGNGGHDGSPNGKQDRTR